MARPHRLIVLSSFSGMFSLCIQARGGVATEVARDLDAPPQAEIDSGEGIEFKPPGCCRASLLFPGGFLADPSGVNPKRHMDAFHFEEFHSGIIIPLNS